MIAAVVVEESSPLLLLSSLGRKVEAGKRFVVVGVAHVVANFFVGVCVVVVVVVFAARSC